MAVTRTADSTGVDGHSSAGLTFWLGLAACTLMAIAIRGYSFGVGDQTLYLPFLEHWNNPALFARDYLLPLPWAKESVTWPALTLIGRWTGFPALFLVLQIVATFSGLYLVYRTADLLWNDSRASWLAVLLWIPPYEVPGAGVSTFDSYFTTRCIGTVLAAAALYFFLKGRTGLCAAFLSCCTFVHVLDALPIAAGIGLALVLERRWKALAGLTLTLGLAGAGLLAYTRALGVHHDLWRIYSGQEFQLLWRIVPDLFPNGWSTSVWLTLWFCLVACALAFLVHWKSGVMSRTEARLFAVAFGAALLALAGLAGARAGVALLAQLSLARGVLWVLFALTLWVAAEILRWLESPRIWTRLAGLFLLATCVMAYPPAQVVAVAILAAGAFAMGEDMGNDPAKGVAGGRALVLAVLLLVALQACWTVILPAMHGSNREANGLPAALVFAGVAGLAALVSCGRGAVTKPWVLGICLAVTFALLPTDQMMAWMPGRPILAAVLPSLRAGYGRHLQKLDDQRSEMAMAALVRRTVPEDATVLVPPQWMTFRLEARRSSFVTFKDRCGILYDSGFSAEWQRRMRSIRAFRPGSWEMDVGLSLNEGELTSLARAYASIGLDYMVTPRQLHLPLVGSAGGLNLYRIAGP